MGKYYEKLKAYIWKDNHDDYYWKEKETELQEYREKEKNNQGNYPL